MRNDALDELDDVPSLTTDARDRDEFGHHPVAEPLHRHTNGYANPAPVPKAASTGPLWALVVALVVALCGLGWWSFQQISLMEQQLVATQESFARISEEAAGRIQDISGKVVATESNMTTGNESVKLQLKQLQAKVIELSKQQQAANAQLGTQGKRVEQLSADVKAAQGAAAQLGSQLNGKVDGLAAEQVKLKAAQGDMAQLDSRLKGLGSDVEALKKQGNPNQAIKSLEQDLLVLRSELDNRPAPSQGASTAEFDAFRAQMTRNISTLQSQVQNLQQQLNMR
ncbi:ATPase [Metapseudomonas lalkuanensis]|uniref:ATPase n=1 Tax=Metapseudomonas lalkuanensis TaxID=2604832 RepID=A0A5J6QQ87_9GAMM|nr:ATPase [Pseudomonas lalkuanensis]QEY64720.1 ATPase [Pseudomonas lalkuanensis]UCO97271.1 ATPase [Pseudomonas lalkuanensis]